MERDFLGAIGRNKEEESEMKEDDTGGKAESDYLGGATAAQWQFQPKAAAAPAFMPFRPARDSFSGFRQQQQQPPLVTAGDIVDGIHKHTSSRMLHHQSQLGFDGQVSPQRYAPAAYGHIAQGIDSYDVAARHLLGGSRPFHHPVQFNPGNPMHRVQSFPTVAGGVPFKNQYFMMNNSVPNSTVGVYGPRDLQNPNSSVMTIFYNGVVNVFDVPVEKAQELMVLASRASISNTRSAVHKSDSPASADTRFAAPEVSPAREIMIQKPETFVPHVPGISSPIPVMSQAMTLPKSTSSSNNESADLTSSSIPAVVPPVSQASSAQPMQQAISAAAAAATPRAVPQARKASLARFLEKRKERVTTVVPYPLSKSPLDSSDTLGSTSTPSKSSGTDITLPINNGQESMGLGIPRNISFSSEKAPNTKLQI
ncbi:hypothetical protein ACUV84_022822 [Puccinellia chinampoensis]